MIYSTRRIGFVTVAFLGCSLVVKGQDWPQWRGPNRDGKVAGFTPPKSWPASLTKKWSKAVGIGISSPALVGDRLYAFGRIGGDEVTTCLNADTGDMIW